MNGTADGFEPGPPQPVAQARYAGRWTLRFTQVFPHPAQAVWAALTEPDELGAWAPYSADRNLGTVGPATLTLAEGARGTTFDGTVTLAQRPVALAHAWGRHRLHWELRLVGSGTELTLLHSLGEGDDEAELASLAAGWHLCLLVAERLLDGTPIGRIFGATALDYGFDDLQQRYESRLNRG